jgi:hypothetical protein
VLRSPSISCTTTSREVLVKPAMRVVVVLASLCLASCTQSGSSTGSDPDANDSDLDAGMGTSSDGAIDATDATDASIDAPSSFKPCPTCCDPILQNDCSTGQACYPVRLWIGDTSCAPAGTGTSGAYCGPGLNNSRCAPGYMCGPRVDANGDFVCMKMCWSGADCPSGYPHCSRSGSEPYGYCV